MKTKPSFWSSSIAWPKTIKPLIKLNPCCSLTVKQTTRPHLYQVHLDIQLPHNIINVYMLSLHVLKSFFLRFLPQKKNPFFTLSQVRLWGQIKTQAQISFDWVGGYRHPHRQTHSNVTNACGLKPQQTSVTSCLQHTIIHKRITPFFPHCYTFTSEPISFSAPISSEDTTATWNVAGHHETSLKSQGHFWVTELLGGVTQTGCFSFFIENQMNWVEENDNKTIPFSKFSLKCIPKTRIYRVFLDLYWENES